MALDGPLRWIRWEDQSMLISEPVHGHLTLQLINTLLGVAIKHPRMYDVITVASDLCRKSSKYSARFDRVQNPLGVICQENGSSGL